MKSLGLVLTNYDSLTMKIIKDDKVVQLKGHIKPNPFEETAIQFKHMATTQDIAEIFHLQALPLAPQSSEEEPYPKPIATLFYTPNMLHP